MKQHGRYTIETSHQIILVRCFDAWNVYTAAHMAKEFLAAAKTLSAKPWACLLDLTQWELGGPEVWEEIVKINHWCAANNQKLEAVVCSQGIQEFMLRQMQEHIPDTESAFFSTESDAIAWLAEKGFPLFISDKTSNENIRAV